jgi:hypothetical protein
MGRNASCLPLLQLLLGLFLVAGYTCKVHAEIDIETGLECVDSNDQCAFWASEGECKSNRNFMNVHCRKSCDRCKVIRVNSQAEMQQFMARQKEKISEKKRRREMQRILQGKEL